MFLKQFALVFLALLFCSLVISEDHYHYLCIKAIQCNISEKYFFKNHSCFAKSYSRNISTGSLSFFMKKPENNIKAIKVILTERKAMNELIWQITIKFHYKYGVIYREILTTPEFELCTLAHKLNYDRLSINRLTLTVLDILTNSVPGLIHECPYEVRVKVFI